jgi:hypothetical protein
MPTGSAPPDCKGFWQFLAHAVTTHPEQWSPNDYRFAEWLGSSYMMSINGDIDGTNQGLLQTAPAQRVSVTNCNTHKYHTSNVNPTLLHNYTQPRQYNPIPKPNAKHIRVDNISADCRPGDEEEWNADKVSCNTCCMPFRMHS